MKRIEFKLNIHTPWHRFNYNEKIDTNNLQEYIKLSKKQELKYNKFKCGNLCNIEINNAGNIRLTFFNDIDETEANQFVSLMVYYISILNGFNCKITENCRIDGKLNKHYFSFPKEDKTKIPLMKDIKFYEISLESIKDVFGDNLYKMYSHSNRDFMLSILCNYYSTVFYKDFNGNLEYEFRNIITNLEALISIINKEKYTNYRLNNKEKIKEFKLQIKDINNYVLPKSTSLQGKLIDLFNLFTELFGLRLTNDINKECEKLANTRNFISHLFETRNEVVTQEEMYNYVIALPDVFRMIFLYYLGFDGEFIKIKFFRNQVIRKKLACIFEIS